MGKLNVLSVNDGDIEITFDNQNAAECIRAKRIINDMLRRGYALLVELPDGTYTRVRKFIEKHGKYIIADFAPVEESEYYEQPREDQEKPKIEKIEPADPEAKYVGEKKRPGRPAGKKNKGTEVAMEKVNAVAVAPTAGG